jgi:hypothetical protein
MVNNFLCKKKIEYHFELHLYILFQYDLLPEKVEWIIGVYQTSKVWFKVGT